MTETEDEQFLLVQLSRFPNWTTYCPLTDHAALSVCLQRIELKRLHLLLDYSKANSTVSNFTCLLLALHMALHYCTVANEWGKLPAQPCRVKTVVHKEALVLQCGLILWKSMRTALLPMKVFSMSAYFLPCCSAYSKAKVKLSPSLSIAGLIFLYLSR